MRFAIPLQQAVDLNETCLNQRNTHCHYTFLIAVATLLQAFTIIVPHCLLPQQCSLFEMKMMKVINKTMLNSILSIGLSSGLAIAASTGLTACATMESPNQIRLGSTNLYGTGWVVTKLNGQPLVTSNETRNIPSLQLDKKTRRFGGADGCNRIMGSYTLNKTQLSFGQIASTMMACMDSNNNELSRNYTTALGKVTSYKLEDKALFLLDSYGNPIIELTSTIEPR